MKSKFLFIVFAIIIISCGKEEGPGSTDPNSVNNENQTISQADLDNISGPCADETATIQLPNALTIPSNYTKFEQTIEIFSIVELSKSLLTAFDTPILPPPDAIYAEVDNIAVFVGDNAYEWTIDEDKYLFTLRDDGYIIKFFKGGEGFTGSTLVRVEQNENCSAFEYLQYAIEDGVDQMKGDLIFRYIYREGDAQKSVLFNADPSTDLSTSYSIRSFNDFSGEMVVMEDGATVRTFTWDNVGNGTFIIIENGIVAEQGNWSF